MSTPHLADARRRIPAVDRLLADPELVPLLGVYGRELIRVQLREEIERVRGRLAEEDLGEVEAERLVGEIAQRVARQVETVFGQKLRRVINATGVFIHTNLGRSPLPRSVARRLPDLLASYCDLELDLSSGQRGERNRRADHLLAALTGAQAGLVVNNNAAAVVLVLAAVARGREVIVSRGELVEIGGSFRIPEIMSTAGVHLVEVGATNRTHPRDYEAAIGPETALLLKVHTSNYRITGFVASVGGAELVEIGRRHDLPVMVDEGGGLLAPRPEPQLSDHPSFRELLSAGCDVVCGSGDKLLGGPQAGLIAGRRDLVMACRKHPLYRAFRPDRFTFAALEEVLRLHLATDPLPMDRLWPDQEAHRHRLEGAAESLRRRGVPEVEIVDADAFLGGGAAPEQPIPGLALAMPGDEALLRRLRLGEPAVVAYIREGRLMLDLRTVDPEDEPELVTAVAAAREVEHPIG